MKTFGDDSLCVTAQQLYQKKWLDAFCAQEMRRMAKDQEALYARDVLGIIARHPKDAPYRVDTHGICWYDSSGVLAKKTLNLDDMVSVARALTALRDSVTVSHYSDVLVVNRKGAANIGLLYLSEEERLLFDKVETAVGAKLLFERILAKSLTGVPDAVQRSWYRIEVRPLRLNGQDDFSLVATGATDYLGTLFSAPLLFAEGGSYGNADPADGSNDACLYGLWYPPAPTQPQETDNA